MTIDEKLHLIKTEPISSFNKFDINLNKLNLYLLDNKIITDEMFDIIQELNKPRLSNNWVLRVTMRKTFDDYIIDSTTNKELMLQNLYMSLYINNYFHCRTRNYGKETHLDIIIPVYLFLNHLTN